MSSCVAVCVPVCVCVHDNHKFLQYASLPIFISETSREYENISLKVPPILLYMPLLHPGLTTVTAFFLEYLKHRCQNFNMCKTVLPGW